MQLPPSTRPQGESSGPRAGDYVRCQDHMMLDGTGWTEKKGRKREAENVEGLSRQSHSHSRTMGKTQGHTADERKLVPAVRVT